MRFGNILVRRAASGFQVFLMLGCLPCRGVDEDPARLPKESIALIGYAAAFRGVASTNFEAAARAFDSDSKLKQLREIPIQRLINDSWSHFFGGTFLVGGDLGSQRPVIAFYNPFLDVAVMTRWQTGSRRPALVDVWVADNQTEPAAPSGELPSPFGASGRLQRFEKVFREKFPPESPRPRETRPPEEEQKRGLQVFNARMLQWQIQFAALQKLDRNLKRPPWGEFLGAVRDGDATQLQRQIPTNMTATAESILVLPPYIRQSLQPGSLLVSSNAVLLFSWSRDFPRFVIFSDYRCAGEWRLNNVAVLVTRP